MKPIHTLTHRELSQVLDVPERTIKAFLRGIPGDYGPRLRSALSPLCPRPVHDPGSDGKETPKEP